MNPGLNEPSHEECRAALMAIPDLIFQIKEDGTFLNYKGAKEDLYVPPEQFIGKKVQDILPEQLARQTLEYMRMALESRTLQFYEYDLTIGDHLKYFEARMIAYEKDKVIVVIRDITDRKELEEKDSERKQVEARLSLLINSMMDEVWYADTNKKFTLANPPALKGFNLEKVSDLDIENFVKSLEVLRPDGSPRPVEEAPPLRALAGETVKDYEEIVRIPVSGELRYRQVNSSPVKDQAGNILGAISVVRDITDRKRMEDDLRDSEERYRALFSEALDGICLAEAETGIIIDCNQALADLVGRTRVELIGQPQKILHPPQTGGENVSDTFKQHLTDKAGQILETQVITRRGEIKEVGIKANQLNVHGKKMLLGIFRDITERKRAEKERQEKMQELKFINDAAVGRELKLIEMEKEVDQLRGELGRGPKYK